VQEGELLQVTTRESVVKGDPSHVAEEGSNVHVREWAVGRSERRGDNCNRD
jgi:hypothetical protein